MLVLCCLFTYKLFTTTATHHSVIISKPEVKDRKVNLALETVLEFNNKDITADLNFLDNVQQFIGKVKSVIDKKIVLRRDINDDGVLKFTDFIHNAIKILNKYDDEDLEDFFYVLSDEVQKYHYRGCKFHELTDNYDLRRRIASELDVFKNTTAESLRQKISAIADKIKNKRFNENEKGLVNIINSLYGQDSVERFKKTLASIDDYRLKNKDHMSLVQIVREGLRSIIFDHYTELNHNARLALKFKIDDHWKYLMDLPKTFTSQQNVQGIKLRNYVDDRVEIDSKKRKTKPKTAKRTTNNSKRAKTDIYIKKAPKLTFMTLYPIYVSDEPSNFQGANTPTATKTRNTITFWTERKRDIDRIVRRPRIYDTDTEVTLKLRHMRSNIKRQKGTINIQPVYLSKYLDLQHKSSTYDKIDTFRSVPKSTIRTLYSKTSVDSIRITPSVAKKKIVPPKYTMHASNKNKDLHKRTRSESGEPSAASQIKHQVFLDVMTMKPFVPRKLNRNQKLKYEINLKAQKTRKNPELFLKKPEIENDNPEVEFPNSNSMEAQRSFVENNPAVSNEELSAKETMDADHRRSYRKSFAKIPKDKGIIDSRILRRLRGLEKELREVKTQIKNDTEIIKDLNSKIQGKVKNRDEYNHMRHSNKDSKTRVTKDVVIDLAADINLDDYRLQKGGGATRDKSTMFKWNNKRVSVRDTHQSDANKNKKETEQKENRKYNFDRSTFNRDKSNNYNEHLSSKDKYRNRSDLKKDIKDSHELNNYQRNPYHAESYNNKKHKNKDYDRSTINRLDDYDDDNQSKKDNESYQEPPKKAFKQRVGLKGFNQEDANRYSNTIDERKYDIDRNTFKEYKINEEGMEKKNDVHTYTYKNKNYIAASKYREEQERKYYSKNKKKLMYDSGRDKKPRERLYDSDSNNNTYKKDKINNSVINNQKVVQDRTNDTNDDTGQNNPMKLGIHGLYTNKTNGEKAHVYTKDVAKNMEKQFDSQNEPFEDKNNAIFYKADQRNKRPDLSDDKQHMHSRIRSNASIDDSQRSILKIEDEHRSNSTKDEYGNSELLNEHNMDADRKQNPEEETTKHKEMHEKVTQDIEDNYGLKHTLYKNKYAIYKSNKEDEIGNDPNKDREDLNNHLETTEEKTAAKDKAIDLRISKENENYTDIDNDWQNTTSTAKPSTVNLTTITPKSTTQSSAPVTKITFTETTPDPTTTVSTSLKTSLSPFINKTNKNYDNPVPKFVEKGTFNVGQGYNEMRKADEPPLLPQLLQFEDKDKPRFNNTDDFETIMNKTLELYSRRKNKNESELFGDDLDKTDPLQMPNYLEMADIDQMIL